MFKHLICFVLLSCASIFASEEPPKVDTGDWITYPIDFGFFDSESGIDGVERITVYLPSEPQFVQKNGMQPAFITVSDQDGMTYNIARMEIPRSDFNLKQSVNFLADLISKSSSKKLIGWGWPDPNPNESIYFIIWLEADKMTRMTLIKSENFVYLLETSVTNEIFRDLDLETIETDTEAFDLMFENSRKTNIFTRSFVIEGVGYSKSN